MVSLELDLLLFKTDEGLDSLSLIVLVFNYLRDCLVTQSTHYSLVTHSRRVESDVIVQGWTLMSISCSVL